MVAPVYASIRLTIPVRSKFRGGEQHIYAPGLSTPASFARPDPTLTRAIVRAHAWLKLLLDGSVASLEELARHVGRERIYVRRVLRLAFLSPALTSDILDGRQSAGLLLMNSTKPIARFDGEPRCMGEFLPTRTSAFAWPVRRIISDQRRRAVDGSVHVLSPAAQPARDFCLLHRSCQSKCT